MFLSFMVGYVFTRTEYRKLRAVSEYPEPNKPCQFCRFLGITGWYREFVRDYGSIASPLYD